MIVELGHFALILALLLSAFQAFFGLAGAHKNQPAWMAVSRSAAGGQFFFTACAFAALAYAFLTDNFSVHYVALNSNTELPAIYKFAAVWGAHEGSLLLWSLVLAGWGLAVALFSRTLPAAFSSRVVGIMGLLSSGFFLFMLLTSNPFIRLVPAPLQGRDLNPVLQDPGLAIHPPMLYVGYVGFAVAFAFAVAALIGGELDKRWARWVRPWTTLAWTFLTIGITIGSFWAYYELGWGGWWFWDPVENASFMPWLVGTALIHSLAVTEKRGAFISWTVLLSIAAFSLSLLGTFLVRSGVLISVHAFASDPDRGLFILMLLGVFVGGALSLYAWRASRLPIGEGFKPFSRETFLLVNNVLLVVAAGAVLLGTLYPLFLDILGLGRLSVGPPYFNAVFVPLIFLLLLALGIGPYLRWKKDKPANVFKQLRWPAAGALVLAVIALAFTGTALGVAGFAGFLLAAWVLLSAPLELINRWRQGASMPLAITGMTIAHIGAGLLVLGITVVSVFGEERDTVLQPNDAVVFAGYQFVFDDLHAIQGPNYRGTAGRLLVYDKPGGEQISTLYPEKRQYLSQQAAMTEAGIDGGLFRDLYVALGQPVGEGTWSLRLQYKPMVRFIWLGGLVIALGGLLAALDRRYRRKTKKVNT